MASLRICLQWTVIVFNTFSVIIGIAATVAAVYELEKFSEGSQERVEQIVQLVAACILVLSAFIGCFGAVNGSIKILSLFLFILLGLIVTHIWKIWRYDEKNLLESAKLLVIYTWMEELFKTGAMNAIQIEYECCGEKGFTDYTSLSLPVPKSCYRDQKKHATSYPFPEGCIHAIQRNYLKFYRYEKLAHLSLIGFESFGVLLTLILIWKLAAKTRRYRY